MLLQKYRLVCHQHKVADEEMLENNDERTENPEDFSASSCASRHVLERDNRELRNQVKSLQCKLKEKIRNRRKN